MMNRCPKGRPVPLPVRLLWQGSRTADRKFVYRFILPAAAVYSSHCFFHRGAMNRGRPTQEDQAAYHEVIIMQEAGMQETGSRMTEAGCAPGDSAIAEWMGKEAHRFWTLVTRLIEKSYPNVFVPEWLFGGKKHGWALRYKKSRSFCTLVPEKNRFSMLIVFGAKEREKVDEIKRRLDAATRKMYDDATTYHDGKWLMLKVDSDKVVDDIMSLLAVKRRPKAVTTDTILEC
jgi:hypothetical protein